MKRKVVDEPSLRSRRRVFKDRLHAGRLLSKKLENYREEEATVFAIPSGGVPVGYVVARELGSSLNLMVVRKIQIPSEPEAGFGAIAADGSMILNEPLLSRLRLSNEKIEECASKAKEEIQNRMNKFLRGKESPSLAGRTVILVDDGLASGYTMLTAVKSMKGRGARKIVVAVPTASRSAVELVFHQVDELVCLNIRDEWFYAVADAYESWHDLSDEEVLKFLSGRPRVR